MLPFQIQNSTWALCIVCSSIVSCASPLNDYLPQMASPQEASQTQKDCLMLQIILSSCSALHSAWVLHTLYECEPILPSIVHHKQQCSTPAYQLHWSLIRTLLYHSSASWVGVFCIWVCSLESQVCCACSSLQGPKLVPKWSLLCSSFFWAGLFKFSKLPVFPFAPFWGFVGQHIQCFGSCWPGHLNSVHLHSS